VGSALFQTICDAVARHKMWQPGDRVGVGVSGGSDSVALLFILKELCQQQGIRLAILHFNHCLRGLDSDIDEQFVAELARRLELPFFFGREDVAAGARARRWNLEDAARRLRYGFFDSLITDGRIGRVAVAHTADDQAETVLARMVRGTGPAGLTAIYPVNGNIVRPALEVRRQELREYLQELGQAWREDASNYDRSRLRSRLRQDILPLFEREIQPAIVGNLGRLAKLSREDEAFWKALTRDRLASVVEREQRTIRVRCSALLNPLSKTRWSAISDASPEARLAVTRRLVRGIVEEARGDCRQWTADHVERVVQLASFGTSGSRLELPGVMVERNFDWLQFSAAKQHGRGHSQGESGVISEFSRIIELGCPGDSTVVAVPEIGRRFHLKVVDWHSLRSDTGSENAVDRDLLDPPLVLRSWQPGDSLRPKGRRSSRKLKHFFRIKRVAACERTGWPVLATGDMLVWARGLPVAAEFAARSTTRMGVIIREEDL
jgi:tRNA(Ile)-lysidine synthase